MIRIQNVQKLDGSITHLSIPSKEELSLDASGLTMMPALIDPHVHFRTPGAEYKEDWKTGAQAAIAGGVTMVFDMPNTSPPCCTQEALASKKRLIENQLQEVGIPLRSELYFGANPQSFHDLYSVYKEIVALKLYMGSTTGKLLLDDEKSIRTLFALASQYNLVVGVHAEDESILNENKKIYAGETTPAVHSKIRSREAAIAATRRAIDLAVKSEIPLIILHMSTKEEVQMVRESKDRGLSIYAEAAPHHLFLTEASYDTWGTKVQMNPPLRTQEDVDALWEGIHDGVIDTIGTDHAPHTLEEKALPYGKAPSGVPGIETLLPLLLTAYHEGKLRLEQIPELTRYNIQRIYDIPSNDDFILVDLNKTQDVLDVNLKTKAGWSPFAGRTLKGWPEYVVFKNQIFSCKNPTEKLSLAAAL